MIKVSREREELAKEGTGRMVMAFVANNESLFSGLRHSAVHFSWISFFSAHGGIILSPFLQTRTNRTSESSPVSKTKMWQR